MKKQNIINFNNKNILITGANGSIGSHLANFFFNNGANLILTDKNIKPHKISKFLKKNKIKYIC